MSETREGREAQEAEKRSAELAAFEIDAKVAVQVMGWESRTITDESPISGTARVWSPVGVGWWRSRPMEYSSDIALAFQVVEAMRAKGYESGLHSPNTPKGRDYWLANFVPIAETRFTMGEWAEAATPALAISLAALAALESHSPAEAHLKTSAPRESA